MISGLTSLDTLNNKLEDTIDFIFCPEAAYDIQWIKG